MLIFISMHRPFIASIYYHIHTGICVTDSADFNEFYTSSAEQLLRFEPLQTICATGTLTSPAVQNYSVKNRLQNKQLHAISLSWLIAISLFERCVMNAYFSFYTVSYFYSSTAVCQQIVSKQKCCAVILTAIFQVNLSVTQLTVSEQKKPNRCILINQFLVP